MIDELKRTVLVAEDDEDQRFLWKRVLERGAFDVLAVGRGRDVVRLAREARPDAIVLDVQMPDQDGFATARQLKADPSLAAIPIVFLTGRTDDRARAEAKGFGAYLEKSDGIHKLVPYIRSLLDE